jgi:UDP-3-O-[3-hydroxymyristoyl] glucosamine N-acyltransferase
MLSFEKLKKNDSSITLCFGDEASIEVSSISHAYEPKDKTFIFVKNKKFLSEIGRLSTLSCFKQCGVLLEKSFYESIKDSEDLMKDLETRFQWGATTDNVNSAMCVFSKIFFDETYGKLNYLLDGRQQGCVTIDANAEIAQNVFIGANVIIKKNVQIYPGAVLLPNVEISEGTIIYPNVTIYPFVKIGKNCRVHSGATIGSDGFGYNFIDGKHEKIWHLAGVEIGDDVEIGSSAKIDGGAFIPTRVGNGTKIDNMVQISHNAQVGEYNIFAGNAVVSGSSETESYCVFAAGAGAAPGARIGKGSQLAAYSVVSENAIVPPGSILSGHPARPLKEWLRSQAKLRQLIKK